MNRYEELGINSKVIRFCEEIEAELKERFEDLDRIAEHKWLCERMLEAANG